MARRHPTVFASQTDVSLKGFLVIWLTTCSISGIPVKENDIQLTTDGEIKVVEGSKHLPIPPGSDTGLYNEDLFEGDIYMTERNQNELRNAVRDTNHLWPGGVIIYKVDENVGCPESPQCAILAKAIHHYHTKSCIRFKEWTGEKSFVHIFFNTDNSGACWSPVGRVGGGEQRLSLGHRCWYFGIVVHELGHAIGFWHEMNRPDRDSWIQIHWNNIIEGFKSAFLIQDSKTVNTLGETFDYKSIMMYDEYAFSKDGKSPTLQAKTREEIGPIWKKRGLSTSDIRRLHKLYQCKGNKLKRSFLYNVNCDFNSNTCGFKNGHVAAWHWKTNNFTDGYVFTTYDTAGTNPAPFSSINFHSINLHDNNESPLGCIQFSYLLQGDGKQSLKLSQAYLERVTQLNVDADATFELWMNDTVTNSWMQAEIPVYITRPFKLIFESKFEHEAKHGTIGLDNIGVLYTPCGDETQTFLTAFPEKTSEQPDTTNSFIAEEVSTTPTSNYSTDTIVDTLSNHIDKTTNFL